MNRPNINCEQLKSAGRNQSICLTSFEGNYNKAVEDKMATYKDPVKCFAPLEVVERLLEIRAELGFPEVVYLDSSLDLADFLDSFGFDVYSFSTAENKINGKINYGDYRAQIVPGGESIHASLRAH